jgi:hypothetical protein
LRPFFLLRLAHEKRVKNIKKSMNTYLETQHKQFEAGNTKTGSLNKSDFALTLFQLCPAGSIPRDRCPKMSSKQFNVKDKSEVSSSVAPPSCKPSPPRPEKGRLAEMPQAVHQGIPVGVPVDEKSNMKRYDNDDSSSCSESEFVGDGYRDSDARHREPEESDQLLDTCWGRGGQSIK